MARGARRGLRPALVIATALVLVLPAAALAIDTTVTDGPPAFTNSPNASFSFSSDTPSVTYECKLDSGSFASCPNPHTINGLSEGAHTLEVRARTGAGTPDDSPATRTWTVDFTSPETSLDSAPPALTSSTTATFAFSSADPSATFQCSLNGAAFAACTSPQVYSGLSDATRSFAVRAVDPATNADGSPASATWTVDATAPDTTITDGPGPKSNAITPSLTFTATEPGTFECSINAGPFAACTSPHGAAGLSDGALTFHVRAIDGAGNPDPTPAERAWQRDTKAPVAPALWLGPRPSQLLKPKGKRAAAKARPQKATAKFQTTTKLRADWAKGDNQTVSFSLDYATSWAGYPAGANPTDWYTNTQKKSSNATLNAGTTGCFSAYGNDDFGNVSPVKTICTSVPYKASSLASYPAPATKHTAGGYFEGQYVSLPLPPNSFLRLNLGAPQSPASTLPSSLPHVKRVVLVATKCPDCGHVRVVVARKPNNNTAAQDIVHDEVIDLTGPKTKKHTVFPVVVFANNVANPKRTFVFVVRAQPAAMGDPRIEGIGVSST